MHLLRINLYCSHTHTHKDNTKSELSGMCASTSKVLAQRPITLVLMMINSCNYSTNDLVLFKFQIFNQDLSWFLGSTNDSKLSLKPARVDLRAQA